MKRNTPVKILLITAIILCIGGFFAYNLLNSKFEYNIPTAVGNTAGNLNNGGLFCEYEGKIYFSNPADNGYLYVMNTDCTEPKKLNEDSVSSINVYGNHIFYVKNNFYVNKGSFGNHFGVFRTDLDGQNAESLYNSLAGVAALYGNHLYYQHYDSQSPLSFYRAKIDNTENIKLSDTPINPASIVQGEIYFSNPENKNYISSYNVNNDIINVVYPANSYLVDASDNYIYYIDLDKNYSLVRLNLLNNTIELLYENEGGKVINYNRCGNKIFFQIEGDNSGLYRMNLNGTQVEFIASGNISRISCTSQYTFFQYFHDSTSLYRVPTTDVITKIDEITIK